MNGLIKNIRNIFQKKNSFAILSFIILVGFPIVTAISTFLYDSSLWIFSFFVILPEITFFYGVNNKEYETKSMSIVILFGFLIALEQGIMFARNTHSLAILYSTAIYLWAWLSMYSAGVEIGMKKLNLKVFFSTLIVTLASIGSITWVWLSSIF